MIVSVCNVHVHLMKKHLLLKSNFIFSLFYQTVVRVLKINMKGGILMALYFEEEDVKILTDAVTPLQAVEFLGLERKRYGSNESILCPDPGHNDRHYGSCMITKGGTRCKCYACNKSFSSLQILKLAGGYDFYDAMCILADLAGMEGDYEASKKKHTPKPSYRRLTNEQKKMIGLATRQELRLVKNVTSDRDEAGASGYRDEDGMYLCYDTAPNPWVEMAKDSPEEFDWMIRSKCIEKIVDLNLLKRDLKNPLESNRSKAVYEIISKYQINLRDVFSSIDMKIQEVKELYYECGGNLVNDKDFALSQLYTYLSYSI